MFCTDLTHTHTSRAHQRTYLHVPGICVFDDEAHHFGVDVRYEDLLTVGLLHAVREKGSVGACMGAWVSECME